MLWLLDLNNQIASSENPWPNTQQQIVLVCKELQPNQKIGVNEFVNDGKLCQWTLILKNEPKK